MFFGDFRLFDQNLRKSNPALRKSSVVFWPISANGLRLQTTHRKRGFGFFRLFAISLFFHYFSRFIRPASVHSYLYIYILFIHLSHLFRYYFPHLSRHFLTPPTPPLYPHYPLPFLPIPFFSYFHFLSRSFSPPILPSFLSTFILKLKKDGANV